jgi:hypothetical protein
MIVNGKLPEAGSNADYKEALAHTLDFIDNELTEITKTVRAIRAGAGLDDYAWVIDRGDGTNRDTTESERMDIAP